MISEIVADRMRFKALYAAADLRRGWNGTGNAPRD